MEVLNLAVDTETFWTNYCDFKASIKIPTPLDYVAYLCSCNKDLFLLRNGDIFVEKEVSSMEQLLMDEKKLLIEEHAEEDKCANCHLTINASIGLPQTLSIFFNENSAEAIQEFKFEDNDYHPTLKVMSSKNEALPVMALFQNKSSTDDTVIQLIRKNFNTYLNIKPEEENTLEIVNDDDEVTFHQQQLPRLTGGGRNIMGQFRYICKWCPEDVLRSRVRGRFNEIKNYRKHFRTYHSDIPFSEFLNKTERNEPKWFCRVCRNKISIPNKLRHQVICQPNQYSSSDSESMYNFFSAKTAGTVTDKVASSSKSNKQKNPFSDSDTESYDESDMNSDIESSKPILPFGVYVNPLYSSNSDADYSDQSNSIKKRSKKYRRFESSSSDSSFENQEKKKTKVVHNVEDNKGESQEELTKKNETVQMDGSPSENSENESVRKSFENMEKVPSQASPTLNTDIESDEDFHEKNEGTSLHASSVDIEEIEFLKTVKLAADKKFCRVEDLPPEIAEAVNKLNPNLNVKSIIKKKESDEIIATIPIDRSNSMSTTPSNTVDGTSDKTSNLKKANEVYDFTADSDTEEEFEGHGELDKMEGMVTRSIGATGFQNKQSDEDKNNDVYKWWLGLPKKAYKKDDRCPLEIFLKDDTPEFKERVIRNYLLHTNTKKELDEKRKDIEASDLRLNQYSNERDQPIIDEYFEYTKNTSTKDVMNMFSSEFEQFDIQKGLKSSTAKQYKNKILEFFQFVSNRYEGFHMDWLFDYNNSIEKKKLNGDTTYDIFVPTKTLLQDFIKSFKYGTNPAANCGIRIFAVKKLLEMMIQRYKDFEEEFPGNVVEKNQLVECLVSKIKNLNDDICPSGAVKHISIASNRNHRKILADQFKQCPEKSIESIMKGVSDYLLSDEYFNQKERLFELAYDKTKIPSSSEYGGSTAWLMEALICIGGNRPCALLGLTVGDWLEKRPGYCPFNQSEENDLIEDDPEDDPRKILKNPYEKPKGIEEADPTGVIVQSKSDKVSIGPPCYIWFPNEFVDLVTAHSLMASKFFSNDVEIDHPNTLLFMNSKAKPIDQIKCNHLKKFIGLPLTAYDFRRSLSTFCFDSTDENIRKAEPSVLRHRKETGFAYYYQKHSKNVEFVNVKYASQNGLVKASDEQISEYCSKLKDQSSDVEWELNQRRTEKALEYATELKRSEEKSLNDAKHKQGNRWILPNEYNSFIEGIMTAIYDEVLRKEGEQDSGSFHQLMKYQPSFPEGGFFPPLNVWWRDMCRVLFGLEGEVGDKMRKADLSVYDGIPFGSMSGRKKIQCSKRNEYICVGNYWRLKIREETKTAFKKKSGILRFVFSAEEAKFHKNFSVN